MFTDSFAQYVAELAKKKGEPCENKLGGGVVRSYNTFRGSSQGRVFAVSRGCPRCGGRGMGHYAHIQNGRCFYCGTHPK